jgi:hypothetical protein
MLVSQWSQERELLQEVWAAEQVAAVAAPACAEISSPGVSPAGLQATNPGANEYSHWGPSVSGVN